MIYHFCQIQKGKITLIWNKFVDFISGWEEGNAHTRKIIFGEISLTKILVRFVKKLEAYKLYDNLLRTKNYTQNKMWWKKKIILKTNTIQYNVGVSAE